MALDWSKEISFSGLKKGGKKKGNTELPSKKTMNLVKSEKKERNLGKTIIFAALGVILVLAFVKFGILDFLAQVDAKKAEVQLQEQTLSNARVVLKDYDKIASQYEEYGFFGVDAENVLVVDALDAMKMMNEVVLPKAQVSTMELSGDKMTLTIAELTLREVGDLTDDLYEQDMVKDVKVTKAASQEDPSKVSATFTITLKNVEEG